MEERTDAATRARGMRPLHAALTLVAAAACSLGISVAIGTAQDPGSPDGAERDLEVDWAFRPAGLGELVSRSQAVVLATVDEVRAGEPLTDPAGGFEPIPTQRVEVAVERSFAGRAPERLELFRLGGEGFDPEGAPAYRPGERYLLFVRRRLDDELAAPHPDRSWILAAPDGRLKQLASGRLGALIAGPVGERLEGKTPAGAAAEASASGAEPASDPIEAER